VHIGTQDLSDRMIMTKGGSESLLTFGNALTQGGAFVFTRVVGKYEKLVPIMFAKDST
jgi:hypothetical protein